MHRLCITSIAKYRVSPLQSNGTVFRCTSYTDTVDAAEGLIPKFADNIAISRHDIEEIRQKFFRKDVQFDSDETYKLYNHMQSIAKDIKLPDGDTHQKIFQCNVFCESLTTLQNFFAEPIDQGVVMDIIYYWLQERLRPDEKSEPSEYRKVAHAALYSTADADD